MTDDPGYIVAFSWDAQRDLQRLEFGTGLEVNGGLLGRVEGRRIVVDAVIPSKAGPFEEDRVMVEFDTWARHERPSGEETDEWRVVGDIHSHEYPAGPPSPSEADYKWWATMGVCPNQYAYCGMIVSPGADEVWDAGELRDGFDWENPFYRAWVCDPQEQFWAANIAWESREDYELRKTVRFRGRESFAA